MNVFISHHGSFGEARSLYRERGVRGEGCIEEETLALLCPGPWVPPRRLDPVDPSPPKYPGMKNFWVPLPAPGSPSTTEFPCDSLSLLPCPVVGPLPLGKASR